jgi:hypothetical protein
MDSIWALRAAYDEARKVKEAQDLYCQNALAGQWDSVGSTFPESLKWEMLVDVLRGRVKVRARPPVPEKGFMIDI